MVMWSLAGGLPLYVWYDKAFYLQELLSSKYCQTETTLASFDRAGYTGTKNVSC